MPHRLLHRPALRPGLFGLVFVLILAACGSDQGPPPVDVLVAPQLLDAPPALLYADEGAEVRVRFRRQSGEAAAGLAVVVSGPGTFSGGSVTDAAGEVRGTWRPGGMGAAQLSLAVEGQVARLGTEVVSREVTALTLAMPEQAAAGTAFALTISGRDGKGAAPSPGSEGTLVISGGEGDPVTLPLTSGGAELQLSLTAAGARTLRAVHSGGASAEATILIRSDLPAELEFMDAGALPLGREDDMAVRAPTLLARDRFGNPFDGAAEWTVGGQPQSWPGTASFTSGVFTPDSVRLGSGAQAGTFRVFGEGAEAGASFAVEAALPVLPRVGVTGIEVAGLPSVAFTDAPVVFSFVASGAGGPVAFGRWRGTLGGGAQGGVQGGIQGSAFGQEERILDAQGQSGSVSLGELAVGAYQLQIEVDGETFTRSFSVREPPVPSSLVRVSGNGQVAVEGSVLEPLVIRVLDQEGEGIPAPVSWSASAGSVAGGTVSEESGEASATWTLPMTPGPHQATARVGTLEVVFTATATETPVLTDFLRVSGDAQEVPQGAAAPLPLVVEARDQFGQPIVVPVQWSGPGEVTGLSSSTSAATGRAEATWVVPTTPGAAQATATAGSLSITFQATVLEAPYPATIEIVSGNGQGRLQGKPLENPLVVRVRDQFGDAIGGTVTWSGAGAFAPTASPLSGTGQASTTWTLPAAVGEHAATATMGGVSVQFTGEVTDIRRPVRVDLVSGGGQTGMVDEALALPIRFRMFDQDDDPMAGSLTPSGDGSFSPSGAQTAGADGFVQFQWTLGPAAGTQTANFWSGIDTIQVTAQAVLAPVAHPIVMDGHYLVQTIQTESRELELVANRSALFRGFLVRAEPGEFTARLRLRNSGGTVVETLTLTPPASIPTGTPDRMNQGTTFQAVVPASRITPGMSYILEIESGAGILADTVAPTVVSRGTLPVRFVPIRTDSTGLVGNVNAGNLDDFLGRSSALPFRDVTASIRAEYVWGGPPLSNDFAVWQDLIQEIRELRTADGSTELYYGVPHRTGSSGIAGIGYIGFPVSVGIYGSNAGLAQYIFNHEVGHNLSLSHAPCGVSGGDANFPNADGSIGAHGYFQGAVLAPEASDVMGYCNGITFGTYHWSRAINYSMPTFIAAAGGGAAYRIWGSVTGGEVSLRSPYVGSGLLEEGVPGAPRVRITVRDANGAVLWSGQTPLMEFDHVEGGSFSVPVPVSELGEDRTALRIEVEAPGLPPRSFGVGLEAEAGVTRVPEAEVYRAPDGSVVGFGVRGVTRAPEGALIQDGTPAGLIRAPDAAGEAGAVVGRAREMLRGGGGMR